MMEHVTQLGLLGLTVAILLAGWRLVRGPTVPDRILAFDTITVCVVGMIVLLSIRWKSVFFLELILVVSLLGFLSGVAFVFYLEKTLEVQPDPPESSGSPSSPPKP